MTALRLHCPCRNNSKPIMYATSTHSWRGGQKIANIMSFPTALLARGAAEIRERHVARFQEPNLHGRLIQRIAVASLVVDQETVTRTFPNGPGEMDVVAVYEVEGGKIAKAWFKMGSPRLTGGSGPA